MENHKNRVREKPIFANINLQGLCNYKCFFCIGNEIKSKTCNNYLNVHFCYWKNFDKFLNLCKNDNINKIYLTGQNTDPLLYRYLDELIVYLKEKGFLVGIRTNGQLALKQINSINKINDVISLSIHSLNNDTLEKITKVRNKIDWKEVINRIEVPLRISIVVNRYNKDELFDIIKYFSQFKKIKYIQLRCIDTDYRFNELKDDIEIFNQLVKKIDEKYPCIKKFYTSSSYEIFGKEVSLWKTVETTINSYNYFTDGVISDNYFIVEGYNNKNIGG